MSLTVDIHKRAGTFSLDAAFSTGGGVMGLLGASGSGKSMTLQCIAGIQRPDRGRIVLNGATLFDSQRGIDLPPQSRGVGYLFQSYALFPHMTVRQNLLCSLRRERDRAARERELRAVAALLHLEGLENRRPHQLSGGQQQRVALARILLNRPALLLLDEPFSALDSHLRDLLQPELKALLAGFDGQALLVTHSRDEAYRLCGETAVIDGGRLLVQKETHALFADPEHREAARLTGCKNIVDARRTGDHEVEVPAWGGIRLKTAIPVGETLCAVGIRAHDFSLETAENRFPIQVTDQLEEPFEWVVRFRCAGQSPAAPDLWWRLPKSQKSADCPRALGVAPAAVLPLYAEPPRTERKPSP
ncbi:sulfate/molybdate ABC transporter ATP-binding protein [Oscillibacter sp.]|uniref:sulfate/molybdate ABC transporter ATP-binding protein n=1 Tax=Oscillibacter sp. TaxID=1945593 RepID=UPI0026231A61|nr:ATP-binding cassette domain-containing protein [Oscillibacter sp.]MDD3346578.1 ATP-binding cassette domain-containing protein [Oscillibacter sp.]